MRTNETASELFLRLCRDDEVVEIEAKSLRGGSSTHSIMETVCSMSNEPGLGGGYILLGVAQNENEEGVPYVLEDIDDPDKAQRDFSSQCASMFSIPVRPDLKLEKIHGKRILVAFIPEVPRAQKPVCFKNEPLPGGAWRRIGSSDQRCTEEDLAEFYHPEDGFDASIVNGAKFSEIDESAVRRYRTLREKVNPAAEELAMDDREMLMALGCINPENTDELTVAGVLLFGSAALQRRVLPDARVDYIRVPGTKWVETVDDTYRSVDMRGPLLTLLFRAVDAVLADLPREFALPEGSLQAQSVGLPVRVLREAIVNALMHRSYRVHQFTQIIRYDNRIEIRNAGHSLKPQDRFGQPGSNVRNPLLANVFHDTNLAETKGTGIRRMRNLMREAHLALPVFESDRTADTFTARLLLHHFLGPEDLAWLAQMPGGDWSDGQKTALIFVRETGAIDNTAFRQLSGLDTLRASIELRKLRNARLLKQRGKSTATYYVPGEAFPAKTLHGDGAAMQDNGAAMQDNGATMQDSEAAMQDSEATMQDSGKPRPACCPENTVECKAENRFQCAAFMELPEDLQTILRHLKRRATPGTLEDLICRICSVRRTSRAELVCFLGRNETYIREILKQLLSKRRLAHVIPEMPKHPRQAYRSTQD